MVRRCQPTTHLMRPRGTVGNWHRLFPNSGIFMVVKKGWDKKCSSAIIDVCRIFEIFFRNTDLK
jgi:hypothetical protein